VTEQEDVAPLLSAYRQVAGPDAEAKARAWAGLARRARAGEVVVLEPEPIVGPRRPFGVFAAAAAAVVVIAGAAYSLGAGSASPSRSAGFDQALHGEATTASPSSAELVSPPRAAKPTPAVLPEAQAPIVDAPIVDAPIVGAPIVDAPSVAELPRPRPRREPVAAAPVVQPEPEPSVDPAEILELRAAQRLLGQDPAEALAQLERHGAVYPRSSLAPQRAVARMNALCQLGRVDEARTVADDFIAAHPSSPLLARVRSVCTDRTNSQTDASTSSMSVPDGGR
jgi:hypothetical protein